jgi:hypothetical protein
MGDNKTSEELRIELLQEKLKSVMPEVNKQVKLYERRLRERNLTPTPENNPLFN